MSKLSKEVGKRIEKKLGARPQTWLASETGISRSKISRIVAGDAEPDLEEISLIAKAFGQQPTSFVNEIYSDDPSIAARITADDVFVYVRQLENDVAALKAQLGDVARLDEKIIQALLAIKDDDDLNPVRAVLGIRRTASEASGKRRSGSRSSEE